MCNNDKGFSLVELIIVIAIMAILVGVVAPNLIKYIEKSKVASDTQLCDAVHTAIVTALMDPEIITATKTEDKYGITSQINVFSAANSDGTFGNNFTHFKNTNKLGSVVLNTLGLSESTDIDKLLKSHNASKVYIRIDGNRCSVWIPDTDSTGGKKGGHSHPELAIGVY